MLFWLLPALLLFSSGCAHRFNTIHPGTVNYSWQKEAFGLRYSYEYDIPGITNNRRYARKEAKSGYRIVAVEVTNLTSMPLVFGKDIQPVRNGRTLPLAEPEQALKKVKQKRGFYAFYLLLTPMVFIDAGGTSTPIGLLLGPGLAAGNIIKASKANRTFYQEVNNHLLKGKQIAPSQTVKGYICLADYAPAPFDLVIMPEEEVAGEE